MTKNFCDMCGKETTNAGNVKLGAFRDMIPRGSDSIEKCWTVMYKDVCDDCVLEIESFIEKERTAQE